MPSNCTFEIDDLELEWDYGKFDFVFSRMMTGSFADMKSMMRKVYECVFPRAFFDPTLCSLRSLY